MNNEVVLATKVAGKQGQGVNNVGLSRKHILRAVEDSLRRLDTDYIDIYYAHFPDYSTPIEETLRTFDNLVQQGKVRYVACSNFLAWQLIKAIWTSDKYNLARFDCIQSPYNLLTREIETELLPFCASEDVGVIVYNSLAAELLTDSITWEDLKQLPRFNQNKGYYGRYWSPVNFHAVEHLKQIASSYGRHLAEFSLAWVLNNPVITSIILSSFSIKQMEDNLGAIELKLTENENKACNEVWHEVRPPRFFYGDVSDYLSTRSLTHNTQP